MDDPWWLERWQALCGKWSREGYESLTADEKVWLNIRALLDAAQDGGVISYFYNSGADDLPDCLGALDLLGAVEVRSQIERVMALFPGRVPQSQDARNEVMDSWDDKSDEVEALLIDVDDAITPLLEPLENTLGTYIRSRGLA